MKTLYTWGKRSHFKYSGSVGAGTDIWYGQRKNPIRVSGADYLRLLDNFKAREVLVGTSRTSPPPRSMGDWLQKNVTKTAVASYVGPILIEEKYAVRIESRPDRIKFN